jgi:hypothetical protein
MKEDTSPDGPPPEKWAQIYKLAKANKLDELRDLLFDSEIDFRCANLLILAVQQFELVQKNLKIAETGDAEIGVLQRQLEFITRSTGDAFELAKQHDEIDARLRLLKSQQAESYVLRTHLNGLKQRFPELFGVEPLTNPDGSQRHRPVCDVAPPAVMDELVRLGLPQHKVHPWTEFEPIALPPKPRARKAAAVSAQ